MTPDYSRLQRGMVLGCLALFPCWMSSLAFGTLSRSSLPLSKVASKRSLARHSPKTGATEASAGKHCLLQCLSPKHGPVDDVSTALRRSKALVCIIAASSAVSNMIYAQCSCQEPQSQQCCRGGIFPLSQWFYQIPPVSCFLGLLHPVQPTLLVMVPRLSPISLPWWI